MSRKVPITLKREITALLASGNVGNLALVLDDNDILFLLKAATAQEGSISAFAKRHGLERTYLTNTLNGKRPVSLPLVKALGFRRCTPLINATGKWQRPAASDLRPPNLACDAVAGATLASLRRRRFQLPSCLAKTRRGGSRRISRGCGSVARYRTGTA